MWTILILGITFSVLGLSHSACVFQRNFEFPVNYECRINTGKLVFQSDGNLVIYDGNGLAKWSTLTAGVGERAVFQGDGNFVIYNIANHPEWNSGTTGRGRTLIFQDDRNFVIYDKADRPVWYTSTNGK